MLQRLRLLKGYLQKEVCEFCGENVPSYRILRYDGAHKIWKGRTHSDVCTHAFMEQVHFKGKADQENSPTSPLNFARAWDTFKRGLYGQAHGKTLVDQGRLEAIASAVQATSHLAGEMAELGVYKGGSARIISLLAPNKKLHLFDTFNGMPEDDAFAQGHHQGDFDDTSLEKVSKYLQGHNVCFHAGFFPATASEIPEDTQFSFVHVDADIYQSTVAAIDYFWPRVVPGGIMIFDDYGWHACPGVEKALFERFKPEQIVPTPRCTQAHVVKV